MAVTSFKPQLWEGALIANYHNVSLADVISTKPSDVKGSKVIFNRIGAGALKDYSGTIAWDDINTTPVEMNFEQKKYFAFSLDDVDAVQLKGEVLKATTEEHAAVLAENIDKYLFTKLSAGAKAESKITGAIDKATIYDSIVDLGTKLSQNKVPRADRFVIVNAEVLGLLSKDDRFTKNPTILENGVVEGQFINGMQVLSSEELPKDTVIAMHKSSLGYAKQLDELEAMRLQTAFADGIRGLCMYDGVILRPEAIATLTKQA